MLRRIRDALCAFEFYCLLAALVALLVSFWLSVIVLSDALRAS